jgi:hypothetical protein
MVGDQFLNTDGVTHDGDVSIRLLPAREDGDPEIEMALGAFTARTSPSTLTNTPLHFPLCEAACYPTDDFVSCGCVFNAHCACAACDRHGEGGCVGGLEQMSFRVKPGTGDRRCEARKFVIEFSSPPLTPCRIEFSVMDMKSRNDEERAHVEQLKVHSHSRTRRR